MYLLAIVLPPLAVLRTGDKNQAWLNLAYTLLGWFPGAIHASILVHEYKDVRNSELYTKEQVERG